LLEKDQNLLAFLPKIWRIGIIFVDHKKSLL